MGTGASRRKIASIVLGSVLFVLLAAFTAMNAFNINFLNPGHHGRDDRLHRLSFVAFLFFVVVLVLLVRNVLKLYADQRSRVMGTRLRTRMLWGAVLVSLIPLVFMFLFSYDLMNRAVDRWFSQNPNEMRDDSNRSRWSSPNTPPPMRARRRSRLLSLPAAESISKAVPRATDRRPCGHGTACCISTRSPCRAASRLSTARVATIAAFHMPQRAGGPAQVKPWLPRAAGR
jgi:two-component system nitrogen regulation sensor histidine kinase NtrY